MARLVTQRQRGEIHRRVAPSGGVPVDDGLERFVPDENVGGSYVTVKEPPQRAERGDGGAQAIERIASPQGRFFTQVAVALELAEQWFWVVHALVRVETAMRIRNFCHVGVEDRELPPEIAPDPFLLLGMCAQTPAQRLGMHPLEDRERHRSDIHRFVEHEQARGGYACIDRGRCGDTSGVRISQRIGVQLGDPQDE